MDAYVMCLAILAMLVAPPASVIFALFTGQWWVCIPGFIIPILLLWLMLS